MLLKHSDVAGQQLARQFKDIPRLKKNAPGLWLIQAGKTLEQSSFSDTVRAQQTPELARLYFYVQPLHDMDVGNGDINT
jgi:hypothetical protein